MDYSGWNIEDVPEPERSEYKLSESAKFKARVAEAKRVLLLNGIDDQVFAELVREVLRAEPKKVSSDF